MNELGLFYHFPAATPTIVNDLYLENGAVYRTVPKKSRIYLHQQYATSMVVRGRSVVTLNGEGVVEAFGVSETKPLIVQMCYYCQFVLLVSETGLLFMEEEHIPLDFRVATVEVRNWKIFCVSVDSDVYNLDLNTKKAKKLELATDVECTQYNRILLPNSKVYIIGGLEKSTFVIKEEKFNFPVMAINSYSSKDQEVITISDKGELWIGANRDFIDIGFPIVELCFEFRGSRGILKAKDGKMYFLYLNNYPHYSFKAVELIV